jgi:hypothetical protein
MTPDPAYGSFFHVAGSAEEAAHLAVLREKFGDDMVDQLLRGRELHEHPRPLTEDERAVLRQAAAPVLRDMAASGAIVLDIREEAREDRGAAVCAWVTRADGVSGMGIWVQRDGSPAERVAALAEQLQEFEVEELCAAGRSATWPECPQHPNSHPLEPVAADQHTAVWRCPRSGAVICAIGDLR